MKVDFKHIDPTLGKTETFRGYKTVYPFNVNRLCLRTFCHCQLVADEVTKISFTRMAQTPMTTRQRSVSVFPEVPDGSRST